MRRDHVVECLSRRIATLNSTDRSASEAVRETENRATLPAAVGLASGGAPDYVPIRVHYAYRGTFGLFQRGIYGLGIHPGDVDRLGMALKLAKAVLIQGFGGLDLDGDVLSFHIRPFLPVVLGTMNTGEAGCDLVMLRWHGDCSVNRPEQLACGLVLRDVGDCPTTMVRRRLQCAICI